MSTDLTTALQALRAAAEPTRLRLLALLSHAELSVGEICDVLAQSQPRVSRHLKLLGDAGLLDRFREQHWVYYRVPASGAGERIVAELMRLIDPEDPVLTLDRERLRNVLERRAAQLGASLREGRDGAGVDELLRDLDVALLAELRDVPVGELLDIGTGSGHVLSLLAPRATRAVGLDHSSDALRLARSRLHGAGLAHCEFQRGDMFALPFPPAAFDTVIMDRALSETDRSTAAIAEASRVLKPGGHLVLVEDFDQLADAGDGNPLATLRAWLADAGLACERFRPVDTSATHLVLAVAVRPLTTHAAA